MKRHLTQLEKQSLLKDFEKHLDEVTDGKVNFTKTITLPEKIKIFYTPEAFSKTIRLIMSHSTEVAWHCLVRRKDSDFEVYDVLSYPQTVDPAHVHVKMGRVFGDGNPKDPTKYYSDWYNEVVLNMPDEEEANLCGQCHSHVNMSTSPSTTDMAQQKEELEVKGGKGYYLFQIWNKKLEVNSFLYDLDNGVIYEKSDVEIVVEEDSFTEMSHKMLYEPDPVTPVEKKVVDYTKAANDKKDSWDKHLKNWNSSSYYDYDDYDYYGRYGGYDYNYKNLHKYSIGVLSEDNIGVEFITEAHTAAEADSLFGAWFDENLDYVDLCLTDAGAKNVETVTIEKAKQVSDKEIIDVEYEELLGASYT